MKTPVLEPLFDKVAGSQTYNFIKKRLQHRCFPVKYAKYLGTPFFTEDLRWLLLSFIRCNFDRLSLVLKIFLECTLPLTFLVDLLFCCAKHLE